MGKFQFHLIGRLDDTCYVKKDTFVPCFKSPFALMVQLRWSKDVHNERDVPEQNSFVLGDYLFGLPGQMPDILNRNCYNVLKNALDNAEFVWFVSAGNLGIQNFKKFGTTHPCWCDCSKDDVDIRA
eukprot:7619472-Ditylum_brightwellii.AAC.1